MSKITVLRATKTKAEKGYPIVELAYKTEDGKTKGMKIFGFGEQKENAAVAGEAKEGDVLDVEFHKNDKGFWEFRTVKATGETQPKSSGVVSEKPARSTGWETSEERAARQVMIVRQSSLSTAVAFLSAHEPKGLTVTSEQVIGVAKQFEDYVLSKEIQ